MSVKVEPCDLRPKGDKIIVMVDREGDKTEGGILLPDIAKKKNYTGIVVAIGPGKLVVDQETGKTYRTPMDVKVGERVHFAKYAGNQIDRALQIGVVKEDYIVMTAEDLLCGDDSGCK